MEKNISKTKIKKLAKETGLHPVLCKVWLMREDLQKVFPDPKTSVYHGMTLVDWAKKYGVNEHQEIKEIIEKGEI